MEFQKLTPVIKLKIFDQLSLQDLLVYASTNRSIHALVSKHLSLILIKKWGVRKLIARIPGYIVSDASNINSLQLFLHPILTSKNDVKRLCEDDSIFLRWVCLKELRSMIETILEHSFLAKKLDFTVGKNLPLFTACKLGHFNLLRHILHNPLIDPSSSSNYAVKLACWNGNNDCLKLLLSHVHFRDQAKNKVISDSGGCPDFENNSKTFNQTREEAEAEESQENIYSKALEFACIKGNNENIINTLLDVKPRPIVNLNATWALVYACGYGHTTIVKKLLTDDRIDPGLHKSACIRRACEGGYIEIVETLLQHPKVNPAERQNK
eukprot:Awhi_evm1s2972